VILSSVLFHDVSASCRKQNPDLRLSVIAIPADFNSLPIGSIISKSNLDFGVIYCGKFAGGIMKINFLPNDIQVVSGGVIVRSFNAVGLSDLIGGGTVYTTPEAKMHGVGFVFRDYRIHRQLSCDNPREGWTFITHRWSIDEFHPLTASGELVSTLGCYRYDDTERRNELRLNVDFFLVKIGEPDQGTLPNDLNLTLTKFDVRDNYGQLEITYSLDIFITNFSSTLKIASCTTPMASESIIYLGTVNEQAVQAAVAGDAITTEREFSLNLSCPENLYSEISFFVEPMYGKADGDYGNSGGVMKIAQGTGMATGVGVRLRLKSHGTGNIWRNVVYRTDPPYNTEFREPYGKYRYIDGRFRFRASLVRLPEPVAVGQIKAAALIHIRYN